MSQQNPKFSIIVACLNSYQTLGRCITSFLRQNCVEKELIIMDGRSTDGSKEIISAYAREIACCESIPDRGIFHAFNKGIRKSSGEWLYFLGADDFFWDSDVLARIAQYLRKMPLDIRLVYGRIQHLGVMGELLETTGNEWETDRNYARMPVDHQALFHNRSLFLDYGLFDEGLPVVADYEFQLRTMYLHKEPCRFVPVTICGHPHGGISTTRRRRFVNLREAEKLRQRYGVIMPFTQRFTKHAGALFWSLFSRSVGERNACRLEEAILTSRYLKC